MEEKYINRIASIMDLVDSFIIAMFFMLIIIYSHMGLHENKTAIFIILAVMIGTLVGYYTNITIAIIYAIMFNFLYASVNIYLNLKGGPPIGTDVYFWMIMLPIATMIFAYKGSLIKSIQDENMELRQENKELVTIDKETQLRSGESFFGELQSFMNIGRRYEIDVYLMLVKLKYQDDVIKIMGESRFNTVIQQLSKTIDNVLREEDRKYILRNMNTFAIIFLSNKDGGKYVENRLREEIQSMEFKEDAIINKIKIEALIGVAIYDKDIIKNPYEFLEMAERDMEYDV